MAGPTDRERWNEKWAGSDAGTGHGSKVVDLLAPWLPATGNLLDVAGGGSTASLEFARRGLTVTVADVSDIGLRQARDRAAAEGLVVSTVEVDLSTEPLPPGPWNVITVANYLQRDLFPAMVGALAPGGLLGVAIATVTNLERHSRPGRQHSLEPGELPTLVSGVEVLHHSEKWRPNGRHEAHLVAHVPVL